MAQIKNKKKYPLITPKDKDFLVATQESTGKTRSISVGDLSQHIIDKIPNTGGDAPIKDIKFKGESLPVVNKSVEIPSKLSEFNNDLDIETQESVENIKTISDLRLREGKEEGEVIRLLGYYEAGDKPELLYKWVLGEAEDDGGSVIKVGEGYWSALFNKKYVNPLDYGKNKYLEDSFLKENYTYIITNDYDLKGKHFYIPKNVKIIFKGGSLSNGTMVGKLTYIQSSKTTIFKEDLEIRGSYNCIAYPEWLGVIPETKYSVENEGVNTTDGYCNTLAINRLSPYFNNIQVSEGYYISKTNTIMKIMSSITGVSKKSVFVMFNYPDDFTFCRVGMESDGNYNRTYYLNVQNIGFELRGSAKRTVTMWLGSNRGGEIRDCNIQNYSTKDSREELSMEEFKNPLSYANIALKIDGQTELYVLDNVELRGDIGVYSKTPSDHLTINNLTAVLGKFGHTGFYGRNLGTNCTINNFNLSQGLQGIQWEYNPINTGRVEISNTRFEQLRPYKDENNKILNYNIKLTSVGDYVYSEGNYFSNMGLSSNINGIFIVSGGLNNINIFNFNNVYGRNSISDKADISIFIDVNNYQNISFTNCNIDLKGDVITNYRQLIGVNEYVQDGKVYKIIKNSYLDSANYMNLDRDKKAIEIGSDTKIFKSVNELHLEDFKYLSWDNSINITDSIMLLEFDIILQDTIVKTKVYITTSNREVIKLEVDENDIVSVNTTDEQNKINLYIKDRVVYINNKYKKVKIVSILTVFNNYI